MAKDPAFLFYPGDWLGGTLGMTFEEKGAYIELLMLQFNRGHMTSHMIGQTVGQLWVNIQDKFIQDKDGLWFNARLDIEKERRKTFTDSRKNNIKGKNQHSKSIKKEAHLGGHMIGHMENENEDTSFLIKEYDISTCKLAKSSSGYQVMETAYKLFAGYKREYPTNRQLDFMTLKEWIMPIRRLIESKKYTQDQIFKVTEFGLNDKKIWRPAIMTTEKLEQHFEQLKERYHEQTA